MDSTLLFHRTIKESSILVFAGLFHRNSVLVFAAYVGHQMDSTQLFLYVSRMVSVTALFS